MVVGGTGLPWVRICGLVCGLWGLCEFEVELVMVDVGEWICWFVGL